MDNPEHREHWTQDKERRQTKQKTQKIQRCDAPT